MRLQITLLGGFEARLSSGERVELASRKAEALLAYLAYSPGERHSRERLADLLWSDRIDENARNSLRQALTALRKALAGVEPPPILAERNTVALDPEAVEVDTVRYLALIDKGTPEALEQACAQFDGSFLHDFWSGEPVFDAWLGERRRQFHDLRNRALRKRLDHERTNRDPAREIAVARELLALDPLQEWVHRDLMRLKAEAGQRTAALKQYEVCRRLLREELGVEPEAETEALHKAIREGLVTSHNTDVSEEQETAIANDEAASGAAASSTQEPPRKQRREIWPRAGVSVALAVVFALGLVAWLQFRAPPVEPALEANMAFPLPEKPSIAVIPFANLSDDPKQSYFADGMTDDLITALAKIDGLFVISQNSSFAYKDQPTPVNEVAEKLGVRYVLEGSLRRIGNKVRVNAQLIDAISGFHIWAERYDSPLTDVLYLQDDISQQVASVLDINLEPSKKATKVQIQTKMPKAYDAFLRGWEHARIQSAESHMKAIPYLEEAIRLDPNFGRAHAALAQVYYFLFALNWQKTIGLTQKELMDRTTYYLDKAMENPSLLSYYVASSVHFVRGEYQEGIALAQKAIDLGSRNPVGYRTMAKAMLYTGRPSRALDYLERAARFDPLAPESYVWRRGQILFHLGRFAESIEQFNLHLERSNFTDTHMYLAANYGELGMRDLAEKEISIIRNMEKKEGWSYSILSVDSWQIQSEKIREQFRRGLRKAGLNEVPWGYNLESPNVLKGKELKSFYLGGKIIGTDAQSGIKRVISISHSGKATSRIGDLVDSGYVDGWHDEKLCVWWQGEGRICAITFRNPEGTPEQFNEYHYVYFGGVIPFSPTD